MSKYKNASISDKLKDYDDFDIYSKILNDGLYKLFKVRKKKIKDKNNEMFEFTITRTKEYDEYDSVEFIQLLSENNNKYVENKKVTKKDFTEMNNKQKYVYKIENIGQKNVKLIILIEHDVFDSIELIKNIKVSN